MEAESRKRGREPETTKTDRLAKKLDVEKSDADGFCGGGGGGEEGEEETTGKGVFDFPWLKGEGEGRGVMSEEEWKKATAEEEEDTFLGTLGRCCCERAEVEMEGGMPLLEDTSTSSLSLVEDLEDGVSLEEAWDWDGDGDGIWTSLFH